MPELGAGGEVPGSSLYPKLSNQPSGVFGSKPPILSSKSKWNVVKDTVEDSRNNVALLAFTTTHGRMKSIFIPPPVRVEERHAEDEHHPVTVKTFVFMRIDPVLRLLFYGLLVPLSGTVLLLLTVHYPSLYSRLVSRVCPPGQATHVKVTVQHPSRHSGRHAPTNALGVKKSSDDLKIPEVEDYAPVQFNGEIDGVQRVVFESECIRFVSTPISASTGATATTTATTPQQTQIPPHAERIPEGESVRWSCLPVPDAPFNFSATFVLPPSQSTVVPSRESRMATFGDNRMSLREANVAAVLLEQVVSPFYLFQYFAVGVWLSTYYYIYSAVVLVITAASITMTTREELFNLRRLHDLANSKGKIDLFPPSGVGAASTQSDRNLVPGDRFVVKAGMSLPCDAVLLNGKCVIDESMLTGESVPVTKTPYPVPAAASGSIGKFAAAAVGDATERMANILYSGTKVNFASEGAVAVAYKTGFRSAKGKLIMSLLQPGDDIFRFFGDALNAMVFMVVITTMIFGWTAKQLIDLDSSDVDVTLAYLTSLTIAVPPGLVACLSVATYISIKRLNKINVFVSETCKVNYAGCVSVASFDKTGTLTDENVVFNGVALSKKEGSDEEELKTLSTEVMATCHALSVELGNPAGDPLEVELMRASTWSLDAANEVHPPKQVADKHGTRYIHKHFEFTPEKLRAGSIVQRGGEKDGTKGTLLYLVKGSPEVVFSMCDPATVPSKIMDDVNTTAKQGLRTLAFCYIPIPATMDLSSLMGMTQDQVESIARPTYVGFVYFSSKLKKGTKEMFETFRNAKVMSNMITGDHIYTAIAVATECGLLQKKRTLRVVDDRGLGRPVVADGETDVLIQGDDPLGDMLKTYDSAKDSDIPLQIAITGRGLVALQITRNFQQIDDIVQRTSVFARMKPSDKKAIVQILKNIQDPIRKANSSVAFCGDGANDMAALSAATVGVSLCDAETTVAACVVSKLQTPTAVVAVLKEGRCSLITAYTLVAYNIMYAIIQLFMTSFLNQVGLCFGDYMYLIQDCFFSLVLGLCIADSGPADTLSVVLPPARFFSPWIMTKLGVQCLIFVLIQIMALGILHAQEGPGSWYTRYACPPGVAPMDEAISPENTTLNAVCLAQLVIGAIIISIGAPYRMPWYQNKRLLVCVTIHTVWILYMIFGREAWLLGVENTPVPHRFGGVIFGIICFNILVSSLANRLVDYFLHPSKRLISS